jgi:hypothetical protein
VQQGHLNADSKALVQQQLSGAQTTATHATGRPLVEGLEDEISMFEYHHGHHMHHSADSPVAREGSSNLSDWQIKAGRTDSYLTRTRTGSSASLWHSEWYLAAYVATDKWHVWLLKLVALRVSS